MNKKKYIFLFTIILLIPLCISFYSLFAKEFENTINQQSNLINDSSDNRNPALYGTSLNNSYTDNKKVLYSKDGKIEIKVGISNEYTKAEYGFVVFVDGIRVPFVLNGNGEEKMMNTIKMDDEEKGKILTVMFSDEHFPVNTDVYVSIATILNPNFMIKSTEYINFLPHHALAAYNFYIVRKEAGKTPTFSIKDGGADVYMLPEEINSMYTQKKGTHEDPFGNGELSEYGNSLDNTTEFLFSSSENFKNLESCFACEKGKNFRMKIGCIGKSGLFRLSLYINNQIVSAFDGCEYFDIKTERDKLKIINVDIDKDTLAGFNEYNSIYLIAVPLTPSMQESDYVRPIKTNSKMLYLSENAEKVNEILKKYGCLKNEEGSKSSLENGSSESTTVKSVAIHCESTLKEKVSETTHKQNSSTTKNESQTTKDMSNSYLTEEKVSETTHKQNSSTTKNESQTTKDMSNSYSTEEKVSETTHKKISSTTKNESQTTKDMSNSYSTEFIRDIWAFEDGTVLVQCKDWSIHVYDAKRKLIKKEGIKGGYNVKKLDNGIAIIDDFSLAFKVYDCALKLVNQGRLPYSDGEEVSFTVSSNGKNVIYCVNEGSKGRNIYTNNIYLNSKKLVCKLSDYSAKGKLVWVDEFFSFDGEKALFYGSYTQRVLSDGQTEQGNCFGIISSNGTINKQDDYKGFNSYIAKGKNMVVVDVAEMDGNVELWSLTEDSKKISFRTSDESYGVSVSENCKYIATQSYSSKDSKLTLKIYDYLTMTPLYKKSFSASGRLDIDFVESKSCAYIVKKNNIIEVSL